MNLCVLKLKFWNKSISLISYFNIYRCLSTLVILSRFNLLAELTIVLGVCDEIEASSLSILHFPPIENLGKWQNLSYSASEIGLIISLQETRSYKILIDSSHNNAVSQHYIRNDFKSTAIFWMLGTPIYFFFLHYAGWKSKAQKTGAK